ncbi:MAG: hypothetical protein HZA29_02380 [Candidatus Omnitrophica bacterium]|nr:hypothetical protein [Candidatus Omnitrophota bacterium]
MPAEEEKRIEQEIDLTARLEEWKEKYGRLDKIFQEKSAALAKNEELLQAELNNRKEFNKFKDMLEKDLKDARDKARTVQVELNGTRAEAESYKKRVNQSEEKVTKMEKALLAKDDEIAGLVKRLETKPAPPVEATVPPKPADPELKAPGGDPVAPQAPNTADTPGKSDPSATNQDDQKGETNNG